MEEKKQRGGYRANAKRPKKAEDEKFIKRQIHFRPEQIKLLTPQFLKEKGFKNLSIYIRTLIDNDRL